MARLKSRVVSLEGKNCIVVDGFLPKKRVTAIYEGANKKKFGRYLVTLLPNGSQGYAWMLNLKTEQTSRIVDRVKMIIRKNYGLDEVYLCRMYIHSLSPNDVTQPHRDCKKNEQGDITAVIYLNPLWERSWGGELILFEKADASRAFSIKPGRLVLFPGAIEHTASAPSISAQDLRYSWVLKFTDKINKKRLFDRDLAKFAESFEILQEIE